MREIKLTRGKATIVDDSDFEWLNQWKWVAAKHNNGLFYAVRTDYSNGKKKISMHRLILGITDPQIFTDHKDGNPLNNTRNNLRTANNSQNMCNKGGNKNSSSRFKGVDWHKKDRKWRSRITKGKKLILLGVFDNEIDAAIAYNQKAVELHGEFSRLNEVPCQT